MKGSTMTRIDTTRRGFLKQVGVAAGALAAGRGAVGGAAAAETRPAAQEITTYAYGSNVWIRVDNRAFACYRAGAAQKLPYMFPLLGPVTGLPMTAEADEPYPHHRSCWLGCDHMNGANFWQDTVERGQIRSRGVRVVEASGERAVLEDHCDWRGAGGEVVLEDQRRVTVRAPGPAERWLEFEFTLTARTDVTVGKTNHALFAVRAAKDLTPKEGGTLASSEGGHREAGTFGRRAAWCGFAATRCGHTESIALVQHPANPWFPCTWFTRDYGFLSPQPFYWLEDTPWRLPAGEQCRLRYAVVVAGGALDSGRIEPWLADRQH
jgi:hypothetical protein